MEWGSIEIGGFDSREGGHPNFNHLHMRGGAFIMVSIQSAPSLS